MNAINTILQLFRVRQWYKNLLVFLALFFSANLFDSSALLATGTGFVALSLVSSSGYIINDIVDRNKDRLHPDKKRRPIAARKIRVSTAILLSILLLLIGFYIAHTLHPFFLYTVIGLFSLTLAYTFFLKQIVIVDVLAIATLFVLRAVGGAFIIAVVISPWLILVPFFLALFLAIGKRHADLLLLKEKGGSTRKVLDHYTTSMTNSLMIISTTMLLISYTLYSFLSEFNTLLYTLPFALFLIFRFYHLITSGSDIARNPERVIYDKQMILGIILWLLVTAALIYV